jgi:hypothetical protein
METRNMTSLRLLALVVGLTLLAGCGPRKLDNPQAYRQAAANVSEIRERYQRSDAATRVGLVIGANAQSNLVSVGEINPKEFRDGDKVVFVDDRQNALASGTVVRVLQDSIHVRYDSPAAGGRAPHEGDVMVRFRPAI